MTTLTASRPLIKTRFCPSPTGLMHLGNTRTALFNFLLAKSLGGIFLLRIEDTDKARSDSKLTIALQEDLKWLGLYWQEGPEVGGEHAPYLQSQRQVIYEKFYDVLRQKKLVYPCFCSEEQLTLTRKLQISMGKPPRYPGTCCNLSEAETTQKLQQGLKPTIRFKVPEGQKIVFHDLVKGEQCINSSDIGDFIICRADGSAPFMFCNAIDDAVMGVTHALRGEDHLTNTPRQLLILRALGLAEPHYGHMSLIVGSDGAPLSKRHGSRNLQELRAQGFVNIAIVNYLARLGHPYATDDLMGLDELASNFSCDALSNSPARFDWDQLHHWQKKAVIHFGYDEFCSWLDHATKDLVPVNQLERFVRAVQPNVAFPSEAKEWAEIFFGDFDQSKITDEALVIIKNTPKDFYPTALDFLNAVSMDAGAETPVATEIGSSVTVGVGSMVAATGSVTVNPEAWCNVLKSKFGVKGRALFMPLRAALTGRLHGPDFAAIFDLLGIQNIKHRLQQANGVF